MFSLFNKNNSLVDAQTLRILLDEILTPKLEKFGLTKAGNYVWHEKNSNEIRCGFSYNLLKGGTGTFTWGVNLNFLPTISNNKIVYHKSAKKYMHHLFEWTDEYSNSFEGSGLANGVITHFGKKGTRKSIIGLFERNVSKISKWFNEARTIENLIGIAEHQIRTGKHYKIHHPNPCYVLAFLYARENHIEEAKKLFETLSENVLGYNKEVKEKLEAKLAALAKNAPS